ncbi:MAG: hypothetical protein J6P16_03340 [Eubacterium sp.]|nr:hypothetical protein [Eubacterium sp.]
MVELGHRQIAQVFEIEYRKNVNASVPTAIQVKKTMNSYIDPDSGKRLGDLIMDISDNDLAEILFQANGKIVMLVQEQLAYASDTSDRTWLDRMSMLGRNGDAWLAARKDDPKLSVYMIEKSVSTALSSYKYEKTNLLDFFLLNDTEFEGDGIRKLYPLAASLTDAQRAALRESTDMYLKLTIGTGAAALGTAIGAAIMSHVISCWKLKIGEIGYKNVGEVSSVASASMSNTEREIARQFLDENNLNDLAIAQRENWYRDIVKISKMSKSDMAEGGYSLSDKAQMKAQLEEFYNHGVKVSGNTVKAAV